MSGLMAAKYRNSGQTCVTANRYCTVLYFAVYCTTLLCNVQLYHVLYCTAHRILVHSSLYPEFMERFKQKSQELKVTFYILSETIQHSDNINNQR